MKKILCCCVLLFVAALCFAEKSKDTGKGLFFDFGYSNFATSTLEDITSVEDLQKFSAKNILLEVGKFRSPENGLIDFVRNDVFGFSIGKVNTNNSFTFNFDDYNLFAQEDAKSYKLYARESFGAQVNLLMISVGCMAGIKTGVEALSIDLSNVASGINSIYYNARFFADCAVTPYASFNLGRLAKFFVMAEVDIPVFGVRFISTDSIEKEFASVDYEWFSSERPKSIKAGVSLFL